MKYVLACPDEHVSRLGVCLLDSIRKMFLCIHRRDQFKLIKLISTWRLKLRAHQADILQICNSACSRVLSNKKAKNISIRLCEYQKDYFRFVASDVLPTNNLCEQSIRHVVIDRKITQGTRSDWGNRWCERIWSF